MRVFVFKKVNLYYCYLNNIGFTYKLGRNGKGIIKYIHTGLYMPYRFENN